MLVSKVTHKLVHPPPFNPHPYVWGDDVMLQYWEREQELTTYVIIQATQSAREPIT